MDWRDTGFVLIARRHGESGLIAELLTAEHGRHAGLVRGGQSPKRRALLQPGNLVAASWRGRLEEHLGAFDIELCPRPCRDTDQRCRPARRAVLGGGAGRAGACPSASRMAMFMRALLH